MLALFEPPAAACALVELLPATGASLLDSRYPYEPFYVGARASVQSVRKADDNSLMAQPFRWLSPGCPCGFRPAATLP